jgi:hypothetical protein
MVAWDRRANPVFAGANMADAVLIGDVETRHLVDRLAPGSIVLAGNVHTPGRSNSATGNLTKTCI